MLLAFAIGGGLLTGIMCLIALALAFNLNKFYVPTPQDEGMRLEAVATKVASFNGTAKNLGTGYLSGGLGRAMGAVMSPSAIDRTSSDETYTFVLQESADNVTYTDCGPAVAVDVAGALATVATYTIPGFVTQPWVRLKLTAAGTTPSITYEAWLNPNVVL